MVDDSWWTYITEKNAAMILYRNPQYFQALGMKVHDCKYDLFHAIVEYCTDYHKYQVNVHKGLMRHMSTITYGSSWSEWKALA